ncbi:MAG: proteasome assembly chaperone family protein [Thermoplasmata archaeon]
MEFTWREEAPADPGLGAGSVVISAFPSAGLATIVAGHYIVRVLQLPRVARFESKDLAPIAVVQGGIVNPTIRVYGRSDLALVLSEFPPTPSQANAIAETILERAERQKARAIVCLEGVVPQPEEEPSEEAGETAPADGQVWAAFSRKDPAFTRAFEAAKARSLEEGVIGGVSGALLVQGMGRSVPVAVLLVSARVAEGLPDHRAGAALIETLDRLLPELKIDTGPLRAQAEQIEKALRAVMKSSRGHGAGEATGPGPEPTPSPEMYR